MIKLNTKNIVITILLASLTIGGFYYFSIRTSKVSDETANVQEQKIQESMDMAETEEPAAIVSLFMDRFIDSNPSIGDDEAVGEAVALFSEGGKSEIPMVNGEYHLGQLMRVQDYPDEGYSIEEISYQENPATGEETGMAEVTVRLGYSGGDAVRVFVLSTSQDKWLIDEVKLVE